MSDSGGTAEGGRGTPPQDPLPPRSPPTDPPTRSRAPTAPLPTAAAGHWADSGPAGLLVTCPPYRHSFHTHSFPLPDPGTCTRHSAHMDRLKEPWSQVRPRHRCSTRSTQSRPESLPHASHRMTCENTDPHAAPCMPPAGTHAFSGSHTPHGRTETLYSAGGETPASTHSLWVSHTPPPPPHALPSPCI